VLLGGGIELGQDRRGELIRRRPLDFLQDRRDVLLRRDDALNLLFGQLDLLDLGAAPLRHDRDGEVGERGGYQRRDRQTKSLLHPLAPRMPGWPFQPPAADRLSGRR
jgi:hypothetical protein